MDPETQKLHIFFFPFMAPGHTIPMVHMANIFSSRGVKATILTTPINSPLVDSSNSSHRLHHLSLIPSPGFAPFEHSPDITSLTAPYFRSIVKATDLLRDPLDQLLKQHHPNCIISDPLFSWAADLAAGHGIPWLAFHTSGFFPLCCTRTVACHVPHAGLTDESETFTIPGLPDPMEMRISQLPDYLRSQPAAEVILGRLQQSELLSYGLVVSSFYEMESAYAEHYKKATGVKAWHVFPVSFSNEGSTPINSRSNTKEVIEWLDVKEPGSVVYVCFGSLGKLTTAQLRELASGLDASGHPFLWMVKNVDFDDGFEKRIVEGGKGLIVRGWAPQVTILNHPAVGGFVTHCGWNSTLEGVSAGVPMITWPLFAEQFFNEILIVEVLGIGIRVGAKVCNSREEEKTVVMGEEIEKAVNELMGGTGEEGDERRRRARELGEKARRAVEEGGSSYNDMTRLIEELNNVKTGKSQI